MPISEALLRGAIQLAFASLSRWLKDRNSSLICGPADIEASLNAHLRDVKNWSSTISFADLRASKRTTEAYVPLNVMLVPRRLHQSDSDRQNLVALDAVFDHSQDPHFVILGQPGAGKTTSMQFLCQRLFYSEDFSVDRFNCPILIRLRELNHWGDGEGSLLFDRLQDILGIQLRFGSDRVEKLDSAQRELRDRVVVETLERLKVLLILDGFDELGFKKRRDAVVQDLRRLALQLEQSSILLTSRTGDFSVHLERTRHFEISPLTKDQVRTFAHRWLGPDDGQRLVAELHRSPFSDTAIRPMTLAHLCAIYERVGRIPEKPKTVYRKVVMLLLEEWDQQRSVRRNSQYSRFETDRKFEFLSELAYDLTCSVRKTAFSQRDLQNSYKRIHQNYGLPQGDATKVAEELETHTGLLVKSSYEDFEFSHKSLQEYLTADFIVRLPAIPVDIATLLRLPNELAVATAISSRPSDYFVTLLLERLLPAQDRIRVFFVRTFVNRLLLEKPDFATSPHVGVALVALYSLYLNSLLTKSQQLSLFVMDDLGKEFDALSELIRERLSPDTLLSDYEVLENVETFSAMPLVHLRRRPTGGKPRLATSAFSRLPADIWVRPELISRGDSLFAGRLPPTVSKS